jgi:hypothetical protein
MILLYAEQPFGQEIGIGFYTFCHPAYFSQYKNQLKGTQE